MLLPRKKRLSRSKSCIIRDLTAMVGSLFSYRYTRYPVWSDRVSCVSKGIILHVIFGKVLSLGAGRYTLQWIISKSAALMGRGDDAAFPADDLFLIDFTCKLAISTATIHFFSKQHVVHLLVAPLYTMMRGFSRGTF